MDRLPVRAPLVRAVMLGLCVMSVVGCGGGGGGEGVRSDPPPPAPSSPNPPVTPPVTPPTTPPVTPPTTPPDDTRGPVPPLVTDPAIDAHRKLTGVDKVLGSSMPNDAIRMLFVDTGLNGQHAGITFRSGAGFGFVASPESKDLAIPDKSGHGTKVALIAAGRRVNDWPGGVSGATTLMYARMLSDTYAGTEQIMSGTPYESMASHFVGQGTDIVNVASGLRWSGATVGDGMYRAFAALTGSGALVVTGTGDDGLNEASQFARLPFGGGDPDNIRDAWLAVGATSSEMPHLMHRWSNACGTAKDNCLVAPGDVKVPDPHDAAKGLVVEHGTDFAAAQVSGAAALVLEKFPYFDGELLKQALLGSATDLGAPGVDPIYGWGLLNAEKAANGLSRLDWGDVHLDLSRIQNSGWAGDLKNDISGDGGITIDSGGRSFLLWMHGNNTYKGKTRITGGFTLATYGHIESDVEVGPNTHLVLPDGSSLGSDVHLEPGASLHIGNDATVNAETGTPVRIEGSVTGSGNLFASRFAPLTIGGDLAMLGQLSTWLGAPPVAVEGHAWVDGMTLTIRGPVSSYVPNTEAVLLTTGEGLIGRFNIVNWSTPLVGAELVYTPVDVRVAYTRLDATAAAMKMSLAPASVGSATRVEDTFDRLDSGLADGTLEATPELVAAAGVVQQSTEQQLAGTFASLSGELHDADAMFAALALDGQRHALDERMDALDGGGDAGAWSRQLDEMRGWSAFDVDTSGWVLGFDHVRSDGLTVGAALSETQGKAWHSQRSDRERNRQVDGQLYAAWQLGEGGYLLGSVGFGHMQRWLHREVRLGAQPYRVASEYTHGYGALSLQAGRRLWLGDTALTGYVGTQAMRLERDGFSEEGAMGFGLSAEASSMSTLQAVGGARVSRHWLGASTRWELSGRVEWQHLLSQSGVDIQARFTGMDAWAPIVADGVDHNVGVFGAGLEAAFGRRNSLRLQIDSRHGGEQWTGAAVTWTSAF